MELIFLVISILFLPKNAHYASIMLDAPIIDYAQNSPYEQNFFYLRLLYLSLLGAKHMYCKKRLCLQGAQDYADIKKLSRKPKQKSLLVVWAITKSFKPKQHAAFREGTIQSFLSQTSVQNELSQAENIRR